MIYDTFLYHGTETDRQLLALRLATLAPVVDAFVLVEATTTHSGEPKPAHYRDEHHRDPAIAPYAEKIIPVLAQLPANAAPLTRENIQRAAISQGLRGATPDDWVLVSDLDELPHPAAITEVAQQRGGVYMFAQRLSYYYLNCVADQQPWYGTRMARLRDLTTPQTIRHVSGSPVQPGGWHMSYLGGVEEIQRKIRAYLHQEYNLPEYTAAEHIAACLREGRDLFGREGVSYRVIPLDATFPPAVVEHPARFAAWFAPVDIKTPSGDAPAGPSDAQRKEAA